MSQALMHSNIYILPVIVLFIIYQDVRKSMPRNLDTRFFAIFVWQTIAMMVVEVTTWIPEGNMWPGARMLVWGTNILYLVLHTGFAYVWFIYIYCRIPGKKNLLEEKRKIFFLSLPMIIDSAVLALTPLPHWVMNVDENNCYLRGPFFAIPYLFVGGYMMAAIVLAFRQRYYVARANVKRECTMLAVYAVIPLCGLVLQLVDYKFWSTWPFTVLAILTIYVSMQNGQISIDGLTGLNNRSELDKYLLSRCDSDDGRLWCLIILDVDDFKGINDAHGHIAGDKVLSRVAKILKAAYGNTDAFLARFGGDEFAVVASCDSDLEARKIVQAFYDALKESNRDAGEPYELALSAGYACYDRIHVNDRHSLMMAADEAMYREKQQKKAGEWVAAG